MYIYNTRQRKMTKLGCFKIMNISLNLPKADNTYRAYLECSCFQLVVHLGVSGIAHEITLEQRANNTGYGRKDVKGEVACGEVCVPGAEDCIIAGLDMNRVCEEVNNSGTKAKAIVSNDAGRYVYL